MIQIVLVKAIILLILIFVWKKVKKPSEKIATVRKSSIITKTVKSDSEKLLFEYRVVEVDALWFAQKVKSNIKLWNKTKGNKVISKTRGVGHIIDVTQSENNILLITIIFNGEELLTNTDSFIDGYLQTIFISDKLLTDLVIQNEEIITFPIEDNKPNTVVADKKLADAKIAADKVVADKKLADVKIAADKAVADKKLADVKIAADKAVADKKLADVKIAADKAVADKKLADTKIAADKAVADKKLADVKITDDYEVSAVDFAKYADKNIEIWSEIEGATVKHSTYGTGKILHIKQRKNYIPLIHLSFNDEGVVIFNSDSFKSGNITTIKVSKKIHLLLETWSKNPPKETQEKETEHQYKTQIKQELKVIHAKEIIDVFARYGVSSLWHMSDRNNINDICRIGILNHYDAHKKYPDIVDISDSEVQRWREYRDPHYHRAIHEYAPLYLNPRNPMLYVRKDLQNDICIIEICPSVLAENSYLISDGNAAARNTIFYQSINDLRYLPWDVLNANYWNDKPDGKRKMCAEVLIYPKILPKYIKHIHCYSIDTENYIYNCGKPVSKTNSLYF